MIRKQNQSPLVILKKPPEFSRWFFKLGWIRKLGEGAFFLLFFFFLIVLVAFAALAAMGEEGGLFLSGFLLIALLLALFGNEGGFLSGTLLVAFLLVALVCKGEWSGNHGCAERSE